MPPCLPTKCQPPQFPRHETKKRRKPHPHVKAYQNQRASVAEARRQRKPVRSISHGVIRVPPARILWGVLSPTTVAAAPQSWDTWKRVPPAHCRSGWAWCHLAVAGYNVVWLGCCYADVGYVVWCVWFGWCVSGCCVCCRRDVWCALLCVVCGWGAWWRVVGVVVLCSVAWHV